MYLSTRSKDSYNFDFLELGGEYDEKELEYTGQRLLNIHSRIPKVQWEWLIIF